MSMIASDQRRYANREAAATFFSTEERAAIDHEIGCYPTLRAVAIEALRIVQQQRGWITDESLEAIAAYLELDPAEVESVATFYNLIFRQPVGQQVILLCDSVSCWMLGCETLRDCLREELGIDYGETSPDGEFTLLPITCLGDCDHAPALMIGEAHYHDLTVARLREVLAEHRAGRRADG